MALTAAAKTTAPSTPTSGMPPSAAPTTTSKRAENGTTADAGRLSALCISARRPAKHAAARSRTEPAAQAKPTCPRVSASAPSSCAEAVEGLFGLTPTTPTKTAEATARTSRHKTARAKTRFLPTTSPTKQETNPAMVGTETQAEKQKTTAARPQTAKTSASRRAPSARHSTAARPETTKSPATASLYGTGSYAAHALQTPALAVPSTPTDANAAASATTAPSQTASPPCATSPAATGTQEVSQTTFAAPPKQEAYSSEASCRGAAPKTTRLTCRPTARLAPTSSAQT